jgi:uncharacterized repeat protein (TIGR01451 family)
VTERTRTTGTIQDHTSEARTDEARTSEVCASEDRPQSRQFESFSLECLKAGLRIRFQARGASMAPAIRNGEMVYVKPASEVTLRRGDIVLVKADYGFRLHRLMAADASRDVFITRGDCSQQDDPAVRCDQILGVAVAKDVKVGTTSVRADFKGIGGRLLRSVARGQSVVSKLSALAGLRWPSRPPRPKPDTAAKLLGALAFLLLLLAAPYARAQVAVDTDPSTNGTADLTGPGTQTLTFNHTTSNTTNRLLLVGVSMNIANAPTTGVVGVTYNGTALSFVGAQNDTANTRRVEQWFLLNPASGTNLPIVVSVNIPATATVGVAAGATVFTDVDQTVPLGPFASADGESTGCVASTAAGNSQCNSGVNIASVVNGMIFDTLAVGMGTITVNGPQVSQWNVTSGGATPNASQDITATGSTRAGAPSVPLAENFNEVLNLTSVKPGALGLNLTSVAPSTVVLNLTAVAASNGTTTVYTGTITGGAGNALVGDTVVVAGFTNGRNNGTFTCTASTATTITLNNTRGVAATQAGTASVTTTIYTGTITGGAGNAFLGDSVVVTGFTNAGNNGTFVVNASTATSLTLSNNAGVVETDPGTATLTTGTSAVYAGTITGGAGNGFAGDSFVIAGFTTAANNGTFTCTASTATTLTCNNTAGVAQTHAGTATTNATFNWSQGAVSINPLAADIGVTTTVGSAVFLGQNTTFTITVFNNGTSAANAVMLSDALSTGMNPVSATPSTGSCTVANPVICNLGNLNSGAHVTVTVVATAAASGSYVNTATVSDTSPPPDLNPGNNTYVSVATVQAVACATVSQAAPGTNLTGVLNTYYPGTANVAAGATSIPVGAATGAGTAIAAGNLLLVIQMQDASINLSNNVAYGNGFTGQGFTNLNSAGDYEFVTAQTAVGTGGGSVTISGAGAGGGLVFAYHSAAVSATAGQSTYQVIVVPQYTTASFSAATPPTALPWNGSTGGVLALDTSGTLTLNSATVSVNGQGFRGGAGLQMSGTPTPAPNPLPANTDFLQTAPATYTPTTTGSTGNGQVGWDAPKGEGIAGTPAWVESGGTFLATGTGYPSGTAGVDGSMARGAPGNAGGGGTDGDPQTASAGGNDQNAGGGGGGNGGAGGFGGDSWDSNLSVGGEGGGAFPATINRIAMGGGGGAGTRNNSNGDNQASGGATGGGIIIIRTFALSGTATLTANGVSAYDGTLNDAGGGGGAGGSIVVLSANGGEGGLTLQANGGNGGDAWAIEPFTWGNRHGPGGGGGGGVVLVSGTPASLSVTGGTSGTTETPGVTYGATNGTAGTSVTNASISSTSGTQSGAECTPDMTLSKNSSGTFTRGLTASYTIPVSNVSLYGPSAGTVTVNDTLPVGLTPTSTGTGGTGWSCSVVSQTVSCTDTNVFLPAGAVYPPITITANVLQTAPSTVTNTAIVGGGGEVNLANDIATNVATVISSADLSVTNAASPDPVIAGNNITYTQIVANSGPSAADNATLVETTPPNTVFVSISAPAGWSCSTPGSGGTGNVVCTSLNMPGSTSATFSMVVKVNAGTANGTVITDTATASSSVSDPNSTNNTASASTVVGTTPLAELTVTDAASPNPVQVGNNLTFTQVVTNTGSAATTGTTTFTENTPANTTLVSITPPAGWTCTAFPPTCTYTTAGGIAAGSSGTFIVVYKVTGGTSISDTVTVTAGNQAFGANSASITVPVIAATQAALALTTVGAPSSVFAGNDITYTQTVTNNGPAAASAVSLTESIPNTTVVSASAPAGWTCATTATTATCTDPSLASGASVDIIVVVNVAATDTITPITATSTLSSSNSTTVNTTVTTPVTEVCDLAVTNSGTPNPVAVGGNITYTQIVTNNGPSNCATATFTEAFPANTTFVSLTPVPAGWTCTTTGPISCTNPSVAPGSISTFAVIVKVTGGTLITDTVTVGTATHDTNANNNSATVTIGVATATQADLSITNAGSPNPVNAGQNITFSQIVANGGPAAASTITLTETLPANTTFVSLAAPGWTCTAVAPYQCTIATLAANATATATFVVTVNTTVASGATITDTASVASSVTTDPNPGNNSATASVLVADSSDLSVTNSASPVPVIAGNNITYAQVVTNAGPSVATAASFTENTPPNTTFVQLTPIPGGWSCTLPTAGNAGTITCTNPSFAAGTASFPVVVKVTAGTAAGTAVNDTATISSSTTDPNLANNSASAADVVATATQADLVTTNSAAPTSVAAGSNVTYTQIVTNDGPAAASTGATFTQTTPPNTNFQSIVPAAGWTCVTPAVGATGTITCTDAGTLAVNGTATFTLVLQVAAGTPSGTNIAEIATATAGNIVPNLTTNSATATVVVANANSADMAIVKTATPSPTVADGDPLTYSLAVTNNGPASATNVIVTDPLPSAVTYLSATTTAGTCSEAGGTVTCLLGTMANAATATVTIVTLAGTQGQASNTATVSADQTDPILTNNSSTQTETITAPTSIGLQSFAARMSKDKTGASRALLFWKTGGEVHNLGFNVYREQNGQRVRVNPSLIAGSALLMSGALPKHSGKTYSWIDSSPAAGSGSYWLEDVDVNGTRTQHGPVTAEAATSSQSARETIPATALLLSQLNQAQPSATSNDASHAVENVLHDFAPTAAQRQKQFELASHPGVKLFVKHEGWHRVTQPDLVSAGLNPNVDPALLQLYAEAIEQPIEITGASPGPGGFGPQAAIEFYGTGIDTPYSGTRVYWLVAGERPGQRIQQLPLSTGSNQPPASFPATVELRQHTTYFAALLTSNGNNFFGSLVSSTPVEQTVSIAHLDKTSTDPAKLEVILQGVILGFPHDVTVALNGTSLGNLTFTGQDKGKFRVNLPPGLLQDGDNTVTLTAQNGEYDTSLVQSIAVQYPHSYVAGSDRLIFNGRPGDELQLTGFAKAPVLVFDITNPDQPVELTPQISSDTTSTAPPYSLGVQVPWSTTNPSAPARHTLLALAADSVDSVAGIRQNHPTHWHSPQPGSNIVMVSAGDFADALTPLVRAHKAEGKSSAVVLVDDLYDEFSFGEHNPNAIRDFLHTATKVWSTAPSYLLLNGRASLDPRNYLGFGHLDFVPTKIVPSSLLVTASDDWFSDFNDSGMPTIATGRFPVSTADEAKLVAGKVAAYEGQSTNGPWTSQALMVADANDTENFTQDSQIVQKQLPSALQVTDVFATTMSAATAQQSIITAINSGQVLVNYAGHGSEEEWSGEDLFDNTTATALNNGSSLPVFLIMNCLNGFFQDVYEQPLAVTLMLAPNGGAVAVLASSGLNQPAPQTTLNKLIVQSAMNPSYPALGDAILKAKSGITDQSVRKTFNLLGDPAMQIKPPAKTAAQ